MRQPLSSRRLRHSLAAFGVLLLGCHIGRVPDDELVVLVETPPATIDPRYAVGAYDFKLSRLVYAALISVDNPELRPTMLLAESVVALSPTEYIVTVRDGARFSDGRPVTADDVVYTIDFVRDPKNRSRLAGRFRDDGLQTIEALDRRRVRFVLSHPHAPFVTDLDVGVLARPRPGHEKDTPIGAGAFVLESQVGEKWRFRPNPYYLYGAPPVRRLTVKVIRDDNSRLLALVGGSGDFTQNTISPLLLDAVEKNPQLQTVRGRSSIFTYLGLNMDDPLLRDVRVRRAIAYAIDRTGIIKSKLGGRAVQATGMLPTFHWAYNPDVETYPYDPARARALLDQAGYPDPDGPGPRARFTLVYKTSSNRFRVALAQVLAAELADVGIDVDLRPLEFATFFADVKAGNFQLFSLQITEISEPDLYTTFFSSDRVPTREDPDRGGNRARYRNPEVDRLLAAGRRELDLDGRRRIYGEIQKILARDVPVIPLWHEDNVAVLGKDVTGYEMVPTGQFVSLARTHKVKAKGP
ncbi:MAG TPA: ABC transporter substrate-binding protein [Polyangia bacterium]|nr:ABC transporter substrate-binding protein [Polyangia bacterium]